MSTPQKLRGDKGPVPPLRALKLRSTEEREWAFDLVNQRHPTTGQPLTNAECRGEIRERLGISLGSDGAYSDFRSWQLRQRLHDRLNQIAEDDEAQIADHFPGLTRDKLREMAIKRGYAMADLMQDPDFTLQLLRVDQAESTGRSKAELEKAKLQQKDKQIEQQDRRIRLLEQKAAQADETRQVLESQLTEAEKQTRLRQIFGMS